MIIIRTNRFQSSNKRQILQVLFQPFINKPNSHASIQVLFVLNLNIIPKYLTNTTQAITPLVQAIHNKTK